MSGGIAALWHRDGSSDAGAALGPLLRPVLDALTHRGPDGCDIWFGGPVALGHQHFWTVPEEVGERQPLIAAGGQVALSFDGRLDNRGDILAALGDRATDFAVEPSHDDRFGGGRPRPSHSVSDAALVLAAYLHFGHDAWPRLVGPMALALWDGRRESLVLVRDPMGGRSLFFAASPHRVVVASEPAAVLRHPDVSPALDQTTVTQWLAADVPGDGRTYWSAVREAAPGEVLVLEAAAERRWAYWQAPIERDEPRRRAADWTAAFGEALSRAVTCRLRATTPLALAMSGGLDSTSVAALASGSLSPPHPPLQLYSWVFDTLPSCDERPFIAATALHLGLAVNFIRGDDLWPMARPVPFDPNGPDGNAFRLLRESLYAAAAGSGARVLLTGGFGDHLYAKHSGAETWLADRWSHVGWPGLAAEWWRMARREGVAAPFTVAATRRWLGRVAGHEPRRRPVETRASARGGARGRGGGKPAGAAGDWLTPAALARLPASSLDTGSAQRAWRWAHHELLLGRATAFSASRETHFPACHGLELRHPFRDRRLAELALRMPAYLLYQPGYHKFVLREAMRGRLPDAVLRRRTPTSWTALFDLWQRAPTWERVRRVIDSPSAAWRAYVRPEAVEEVLARGPRGNLMSALPEGAPNRLLLWHLVSFELWSQARNAINDGLHLRLDG